MPELIAEVERLSLVIDIGSMPVRVNTTDPGFLGMLHDRYTWFISDSGQPEMEFDVEPAVALHDAETLARELATHEILQVSEQPIPPRVASSGEPR